MALIDNQIAYYTLDSNLNDATGNGNTLINNGFSQVTGLINGGYGSSTKTQQLYTPNLSTQYTYESMTTNFWFKCSSGSGTEFLWVDQGWADYTCQFNSSGNLSFRFASGTLSTVSGNFRDGVWHMITMVFKGNSGMDFYVDGTFQGSVTRGPNNFGTFIQQLGSANASPVFGVVADFDEWGIWNRQLNSTEVSELYNSGAGLQYPYTTQEDTNNALVFGTNL